MKRAMNSDSDSSLTPLTTKKPKFIPITDQPIPLPQSHQTTQSNSNSNSNSNSLSDSDSDSDSQFAKLDENLLYEVFKHADGKTLATASCVSKQWNRTAQDERLWELICTRQWSNSINYGTRQLRSVVLALGGFRRLHALNHSKSAAPTNSDAPVLSPSAPIPIPAARVGKRGNNRLGKDEVHLSLSLLSIRFYEKMNSANKRQ